MKIGDYYKVPHATGHWYHKIVGEDGNKFLILDLTFPVQGIVKATKSVVEYGCEQVSEKEVLDWIVEQIQKENQVSIQEKMDDVKHILDEIKKEISKVKIK